MRNSDDLARALRLIGPDVDGGARGSWPAPDRESDTPPLTIGARAEWVATGVPLGVLVLDRDGTHPRSTQATRDILGLVPEGTPERRTCCRLFGCGEPDGPLAGSCLTDLVLDIGELADLRVRLPGGRAAGEVLLRAIRFGQEEPAVVISVLNAGLRDTGEPQLTVFTLGQTRVVSGDGPLDGDWIDQRSGQLLKLLASRRGGVVRSEEIANSLWPDQEPSAANVRWVARELRNVLEPGRERHRASAFVQSARGGYSLNAARVNVDADRFEQLARTGLRAYAAHEPAVALMILEEARSMYSGEFIADEPYALWAAAEREHVHALCTQVLDALVRLYAGEGDYARARAHAESLELMEPWDADVLKMLLVLLLRQGRRSAALRHFGAFCDRLRREFDEEPPFAFSDLRADEDLPPA